jgi:hypothetical protein
MADPKISWQVLERINENDEEYIPTRNYTEDDSYTSGEYVQKRFRVWNNYYGSTDVDDALDCKLILAFKNYEDNFLLHLINIKVNEGDWVVPNIDTDRGVVDIKDLSGLANNGTSSNAANFCEIEINIGPLPKNMRCELKSLYFYIEYKKQ